MGRFPTLQIAASAVVGAAFCCLVPVAYARPGLSCAPVAQTAARVLRRLPHDRTAFTQGLIWHNGHLIESVGEYGRSEARRVDPASGRIVARRKLPPNIFAEGIARVGNEVVQLSWTNGVAHRLDAATLAPRGWFRYRGEGWGLSDLDGGFVRSDGSATLMFHDATTFAETRRVAVTMDGVPLSELNELETIDGSIWANVWHRDFLVVIDPATGCVTRRIDLSAIVAQVAATDEEAVANGIAWDDANRRLYVTGKLWPSIFEIAVP